MNVIPLHVVVVAHRVSLWSQLMLSSEIHGLFNALVRMVEFFMDMMSKLSPTLNRLQGYLTSIKDMNLMSNSEFRNVSPPDVS